MVKKRMNKKNTAVLKIAEIIAPFVQERSPIKKAVMRIKMKVENR